MGKKKWIKGAIKEPGALRASVQRLFGKKGFTKSGTIKVSILRLLAEKARMAITRRRARTALTLRKLRK